MSAGASYEHQMLIRILSTNRVATYNWVACFTLIWCDTLSTLPREVKYIWGSSWSFPKCMYLVARYWGIFAMLAQMLNVTTIQTSLMRCRVYLLFQLTIGGGPFFIALVNQIFIKRLQSLYSDTRWSLNQIVLAILATCNVALLVYIAAAVTPDNYKTIYLAPQDIPYLGCMANSNMNFLIPAFLLAAFISSTIFFMTVWWYYAKYKSRALSRRAALPPLLSSIMKDGIAFFLLHLVTIIVFGALTVMVLVSKTSHQALASYAPWHLAALIFSGSRLILHLREASVEDAQWFARSCVQIDELDDFSMIISREITFT